MQMVHDIAQHLAGLWRRLSPVRPGVVEAHLGRDRFSRLAIAGGAAA
jgi:hypothetical protein